MSVGGGGEGEPMVEMNTTPLIDVMLVLLIMLIVTLPIMTHAVKLDMPRPNPNQVTPPEPPVVITLTIDYDGTVLWNGTPVAGLGQLERYLLVERDRVPQPEVHIRPYESAKYEVVAKVLAITQRTGIKKMGIFGNE
jgi:biopolymer transport protein ExbD